MQGYKQRIKCTENEQNIGKCASKEEIDTYLEENTIMIDVRMQ